MTRLFNWLWNHGVLNNLLTGAFVVLPVAISIGIMAWAVDYVRGLLGKGTWVGDTLRGLGMEIVDDSRFAALVGWGLVIGAIWVIGLLFRVFAKHEAAAIFQGLLARIPIFSAVYKPVSQVIGMFNKKEGSAMQGMKVCLCHFGSSHGGSFVALIASPEIYVFNGRSYRLIYIPTSPMPMSGGLILVPVDQVEVLEDMKVDDMMQLYLSIGVMMPQICPQRFKGGADVQGAPQPAPGAA